MRKRYLFATAREYWHQLPAEEHARIQTYTRKEIEELPACAAPQGSKEYWRLRIDAALSLHYHQNPIQRHEAAFALGAFQYQDLFERDAAVKNLREAMRFDTSPTVRHKAIEALGSSNTFCTRSMSAAADMCKINHLWPDYHDVTATVEESFTNILNWLKTRPNSAETVRELEAWKRLPHLQLPQGMLTGSLDEAWSTYAQYLLKKKGEEKK